MVHLPNGFYIPLHNEEWDKFLDHAELKPKKNPQIAQKKPKVVYIDLHKKKFGKYLDHDERKPKKLGIKGKMMIAKKNYAGKAQMKKTSINYYKK